jgi:Cellulose binding domain
MPSSTRRALACATLLASAIALLASTATRADAAVNPTPTLTITVGPSPTPVTPSPSATSAQPDPTAPATTGPPPASQSPTPPSGSLPAPADLHVATITPGSVTLAWTASPGATGYAVHYGETFGDVYRTQTVGNVTTVTISAGIYGTGQYRFSVAARDAERMSTSSTPITVVTPAGIGGDVTPPSAPTDLAVQGSSASGAILKWSGSTDDVSVTGYRVYEFDGWYTSRLLGTTTVAAYVAPFTGSGSATGLRYYYVRAADAAGNLSIASNTVPAPTTTTPPPSDPPITPTCKIAYRSTAQWADGFVAEISITNTGTDAVDGWVLTFPFGGDQKITSVWHATSEQSDATVTLTAADWNRTIDPGATATLGLMGSFSASNAPPVTAALNGAACTLA